MDIKEYKALPSKKRNKYGAKPTTVDGISFDSKGEAQRFSDLKLLQRAGKIERLVCHPSYDIAINNFPICTVELDFNYWDAEKKRTVYEDFKGSDVTKTPISRLKRKLLEASYNITVTITGRKS